MCVRCDPFILTLLRLNIQWIRRGYPSRITDPAPLAEVGGVTKIDSIQNVMLLRGDLHDAWDNYKFSVNPDVRIFLIYTPYQFLPQVLTAGICRYPFRSRLR